jgi:hypothetical protein
MSVEFVLGGKLGLDDAHRRLRARDQRLGQAVIGLRAEHQIDDRRAAHDFLALGLGNAAGDTRSSGRCLRHCAVS